MSFTFLRTVTFKNVKLTFLAQFIIGNKICPYCVQCRICVYVHVHMCVEKEEETDVSELI